MFFRFMSRPHGELINDEFTGDIAVIKVSDDVGRNHSTDHLIFIYIGKKGWVSLTVLVNIMLASIQLIEDRFQTNSCNRWFSHFIFKRKI